MQRPKIPKRKRYPVWSVKTITALAVFVLAVTAASVFLLGKRSIFYETELTLAIIAAALFLFLSVGLYHGVRVKRRDVPGVDTSGIPLKEVGDSFPDVSNVLDGIDGGDEGCLAALLALGIAILAGIALLFLLWLLLNLGIVLWVFLLAALSWVFYLALRQVFAKSRVCKGNLPASLGYALAYTLLYTGWLFALVWIAHGLLGDKLGKS